MNRNKTNVDLKKRDGKEQVKTRAGLKETALMTMVQTNHVPPKSCPISQAEEEEGAGEFLKTRKSGSAREVKPNPKYV